MSVNKVIELYLSGMSVPQVSNETGIPRSTVYFRLKKADLLRNRGSAVRMAAKEGRLGSGMLGKKRVFSDEHKENIRLARVKWGNTFATGKSLKPSGYFEITRGKNKGRTEHRLVMEAVIGRALLTSEVVHHIDGDKTNNSPSNLMIMSASEHASIHASERNNSRERDSFGRYK